MCACDWVATHHDHLTALVFADFISEFHKEFLPAGWDDELHACICNSRLRFSDSFPKWLNNICHSNILLRGTAYHFADDTIHLQLETLLDTDLHTHCKNCNVKGLVEAATNSTGEKMPEACLTCWISELHKLMEEHAQDTKHYLKASEELQQAPKCQALGNNSHPLNVTSASLSFPSKVHPTTSSSTCSKPPHLTENKHSLLFKHQGCLKCHCGYQNHHTPNCPNDFPNGQNYKELMEELLLNYKQSSNVPSGSKPIGAVMSSTRIEEVADENDSSVVIGALCPRFQF